jgi:hypothetical protein
MIYFCKFQQKEALKKNQAKNGSLLSVFNIFLTFLMDHRTSTFIMKYHIVLLHEFSGDFPLCWTNIFPTWTITTEHYVCRNCFLLRPYS